MRTDADTVKSIQPSVKTLAITGGPSGGKTTLVETLKKELGSQVAMVPEAASILYRGGFPRLKTDKARKHTQKAIYFLQRELEVLIIDEKKAPLLLCDRGSLDGMAYWPGESTDFLEELNTTRENELGRYDWVLHLDTAAVDSYDSTNPVRTESHPEALVLNERIKTAWQGHPQRIIITSQQDFLEKMLLCVGLIRMILENKTYQEVMKYVAEHQ